MDASIQAQVGMPPRPPMVGTLLADAAALAPLVAEHRDAIERDRRLPLPLVRALQGIGAIRMTVPKAYGGLELDPAAQFEVVEALSRVDASVG